MKVDYKLVTGDVLVLMGMVLVFHYYNAHNIDGIIAGTVVAIAGVIFLIISMFGRKKKTKAFMISNLIYASSGVIFALFGWFSHDKITISFMAMFIIVVSAICLNIANFEDKI